MVLLSQCKKEIEPNVVTIPDDNFLNALIELGVDTNGDGIISPAEAEVITFLDVRGYSISDMTGIEAFVYLDTLYCASNQLTTLDVSNNTALTELHCWGNQLTSLNVSTNTALKYLYCSENQLTNLDVSNNTALDRLYCRSNQLTNLDVSNNILLLDLRCEGNQLTSLDVSNNIALTILWCSGIQLSTLDLSNNTALGTDVIFCCTPLDISDIPSLYQVCVWEMPFPPAGVSVDTTNSPNVYFTMDCSK